MHGTCRYEVETMASMTAIATATGSEDRGRAADDGDPQDLLGRVGRDEITSS
jgi:hypothetical protein